MNEQQTDLMHAYLFIVERPETLPSDIADKFGHNMRYSRELLGVLMGKKLVKLDTSTDIDFYAATEIKTDPETQFNKALGIKAEAPAKAVKAAKPKATKANGEGFHPCLCGCKENVPPKSNYRPGHDARHAGVVGRAAAADPANAETLLAALPTDKLRDKAGRIWEKQTEKANAKAHPSGAKAPTEGIAKVGKNERPARQFDDGTVEVMDPVSGEWVPASKAATKTFQEG